MDLPNTDPEAVLKALSHIGRDPATRTDLFELLRQAELRAPDPETFRDDVRWVLVSALLKDVPHHRMKLKNGLIFDLRPESRLERALLLTLDAEPDHVWEPQTTRLLTMLAARATNAIVGGAYIGDQVLPMAHAMPPGGRVHAFEITGEKFGQLVHNMEINGIKNVVACRNALWDSSGEVLSIEGPLGLGFCEPGVAADGRPTVTSTTMDDYARSLGLDNVGIIMLDMEGGEERALKGAQGLLRQPAGKAPVVIFEVNSHYMDWTNGLPSTSIIQLMMSNGYQLFAIRDFHDNRSMEGWAIEVIPADSVYLKGPKHGFNMLATKDPDLVARLGLSVVRNVSPKLLPAKDPALFHPLDRPL